MRTALKLVPVFLLVGMGLAMQAYAPSGAAIPLTLTIDNPDRVTTSAVRSITFTGSITNDTGGDLLASDLFIDFSGYDPTFVSLSQLLGDPDFQIQNGTRSAQINLFTFDIAPPAPFGAYFADVFLQDASFPTVTSNFATVSVTIPEPGTAFLLIPIVVAVLHFRCKRICG